ncbi:Mph(C) family macrolide 2'-phosphotransferase [Mammaliicoccus fleurettii]|uniref:Mph(C) family macrolide 2'-phosphotransferase n=1 Tax=Mammaliicoccus fleurettii TaxID=150056 RepID=UPI002DBBEFD6|nr:Mph(C) family macrolide 2'-phosphotransferase [Mammaliicoccus fleurettii]MEB7781073.1 Mph(C) family macrolide 2'-phosphotransferase [Mammaliicoccus fleurettii]
MTHLNDIVKISKQYGLNIQPETISLNESGLDFQVAFGEDEHGQKWVLRIPRRADVYKRTHSEKQIVDFLQEHVSFEVPKWKVHEEDLIAYPILQGIPVATIDPEIQNYVWEIEHKPIPDNFVNTLAEILVDLHGIPEDIITNKHISTKTIHEIKRDFQNRMHKVKETYGVSSEIWNRWQRWIDNDELWPEHATMIHGDLHPGHIMVDSEANVTGLIDWTEATHSDPSMDFMGHHRVFGEEGLEQLITAYKKAGGNTWPRMKEHVIELNAVFPLFIAEFAIESGEAAYESIAKKELGVEE